MKKYFTSILIGIASGLSFAPSISLAAQLSFQPDTVSLPHPDNYTVTLLLDTQGESINAVEGTLVVNAGAGDVIAVSDSGSIITYWINRPELDKQQRTIEFRGAVPGGYTGKGILFSIIMPHLEQSGVRQPFTITNLKALRNDGLGTQARTTVGTFTFGQYNAQVEGAISDQLYVDPNRIDNIPPEVFSPQLSQDDRVFGGKWFVTFSTQDKQSGVDHYEIQETRSGRISSSGWKRAESPYQLGDQELHSYVYVLAIDRQGNERVIKVFPRSPLAWYKQDSRTGFIVLGVIIIVVAGFLTFKLMRKQLRSRK